MKTVRLGKSGLVVTKPAMGCLPVQRCSMEDSVKLLRSAYERGIRFFDTAAAYTDSQEKIGLALSGVRDDIVIATKSAARTCSGVLADIENSLRMMKTDYIDLFQFHNVPEVPDAEDKDGAYAGALIAKERGWIGHIGVTSHRVGVIEQCIDSGAFETVQFPFSYISAQRDIDLAERAKNADVGFIAMKGLAGGLLGTNPRACHAFMNLYDNVAPIWGIQTMEELECWMGLAEEDPVMDEQLSAQIKADREQLSGNFCRSCGYCMPCPMGIEIPNAARMSQLMTRSPYKPYLTAEWQAKMHKIEDCINCRRCVAHCPYSLDTPRLLREQLQWYEAFCEAHKSELG